MPKHFASFLEYKSWPSHFKVILAVIIEVIVNSKPLAQFILGQWNGQLTMALTLAESGSQWIDLKKGSVQRQRCILMH